MGEEILNSMLYSFNGFPALPIFIGDFLLTQLQNYFFIPVMLMAVFLGYHYITKHNGGGFNQIAYRAVTATGIVFAILQANMPMNRYISEVLGTSPETFEVENGETVIKDYKLDDLSVFNDVNHYLVVGYMSTFISFSNVIANNLTRKIIYGKTEIMDIGFSGQEQRLMGYFPSLLYNIQKGKQERFNAAAQAALDKSGLKEFYGDLNASNANLASKLRGIQRELCVQGYSTGAWDVKLENTNLGFTGSEIRSPILASGSSDVRGEGVCRKMFDEAGISQVDANTITSISGEGFPLNAIINYAVFENEKGLADSDEKVKTANLLSDFIGKDKVLRTQLYSSIVKTVADKASGLGSKFLESRGSSAQSYEFVSKILETAPYYYDIKGAGDEQSVIISTLNGLNGIYEAQLEKFKKAINNANLGGSESFASIMQAGDPSKIAASLTTIVKNLDEGEENILLEINQKYAESRKDANEKNQQAFIEAANKAKYLEVKAQARQTLIAYAVLMKYYDLASVYVKNYTFEGENALNAPSGLGSGAILSDDALKQLFSIVGMEDDADRFAYFNKDLILSAMNQVSTENFVTNDSSNLIRKYNKDIIDTVNDGERADLAKRGSSLTNDLSNSLYVRWKTINVFTSNIVSLLINEMNANSTVFDRDNPFSTLINAYQNNLAVTAGFIQKKAIMDLGKDGNGLEKIRTIQGMFSVFNTMRPEGVAPVKGFTKPISWMDLGIFYTVFKTTYEGAVRNAFILSQTGKASAQTITNMANISQVSMRSFQNNAIATLGGIGAVAVSANKFGDELVKNFSEGVKTLKDGQSSGFLTKMMKGAGSTFSIIGAGGKFIAVILFVLFIVNIILPTGIWFIALLTYYIEIALYLAIAPIAIILMIFQSYHGAVQKYINVLIMLLLYPSVLVALYFIVLFIDMMIPMLLFSFIPFFNDVSSLTSAAQLSFGGDNAVSTITEWLLSTDAVGSVASFASLAVMSILSVIMSTYLLFMLLRANSILASTLQGGGMNMVDSSSSVGGDTERKLKAMTQVGGMSAAIG